METPSRYIVYPDAEALSQAAAGLFAEEARRAAQSRGRFAVLLAGGNTPRRMYELLAQPPLRDRISWWDADIFWGDERWVPPEDPRNNASVARRALLDRVPIPPTQIHPIPYRPTPRQSAAEYERLLRAYFAGESPRFDLVFLGLGDNGHTASLFPEAPALTERDRWVTEVQVPEQDLARVTLTPHLINQSQVVAFMVAGAGKAGILREVLYGVQDPRRLPAQLIKPGSGKLLWLVDREAARLLRTRERGAAQQ